MELQSFGSRGIQDLNVYLGGVPVPRIAGGILGLNGEAVAGLGSDGAQ
ncbi:hypothetical protein ACX80D_10475 [Arthrobacter sp. Sr24]